MSFSVINNMDTATSPATDRSESLVPAPINYADWRVSQDEPNEVILTNLSVPLEQPETVRFAVREVKDIFVGSKIDPPIMTGTASYGKRGISGLVQTTVVGGDVGGTLYPARVGISFVVPLGAAPTADDMIVLINRLLGHLYETGEDTPNSKLDALLRSALKPSGM